MLGLLDALGHGREPEVTGHVDDRAGEFLVLVVAVQLPDERTVHLQHGYRQLLEIGQRRVARAEIVDGDVETGTGQGVQLGHRQGHVLHQAGFGHLQLQVFGGNSAGADDIDQPAGEIRLHQLHRRDVDRQGEIVGNRLLPAPASQGRERFKDHPAADAQDLATGLGDGHELPRGNPAVRRAFPAQQRLGANNVPGGQGHLGLVRQM